MLRQRQLLRWAPGMLFGCENVSRYSYSPLLYRLKLKTTYSLCSIPLSTPERTGAVTFPVGRVLDASLYQARLPPASPLPWSWGLPLPPLGLWLKPRRAQLFCGASKRTGWGVGELSPCWWSC